MVAIDSDATQERLNEIAATAHIPFDETLIAAEDASVIREALSRLSPDQRTALVMWEMEGRSTEEIAVAIGTTPANVRHVVARSRASFVRILSEWVIDDETGATALDSLSSSYRKAAELAKKSSTVAFSLVLLLAAFVGFNSFNHKTIPLTSPTATQNITSPTTPVASAPTSSTPVATKPVSSAPTSSTPLATKPVSPAPSISANTSPISKLDTLTPAINAMIAPVTYAGLGPDGLPVGFTVTDLTGDAGTVIIGNPAPVITTNGITLTAPVMSYDPKAVNVLINQVIRVDGSGTSYTPTASVSMNGSWVALNSSAISTDISRLSNGNYLVSSTIITVSPIDAGIIFPVSQGIDVTSIPTSISVRLVLNPGKTQILAEAIQVAANGVTK